MLKLTGTRPATRRANTGPWGAVTSCERDCLSLRSSLAPHNLNSPSLARVALSHPLVHTQAALLASLWSGGSERRSTEEADDHQTPQAGRPDARTAREGAGSGTKRQGGDSSGQKGKTKLATPSLLWIFFLAATILGGSVFVAHALLTYNLPRQLVVAD